MVSNKKEINVISINSTGTVLAGTQTLKIVTNLGTTDLLGQYLVAVNIKLVPVNVLGDANRFNAINNWLEIDGAQNPVDTTIFGPVQQFAYYPNSIKLGVTNELHTYIIMSLAAAPNNTPILIQTSLYYSPEKVLYIPNFY